MDSNCSFLKESFHCQQPRHLLQANPITDFSVWTAVSFLQVCPVHAFCCRRHLLSCRSSMKLWDAFHSIRKIRRSSLRLGRDGNADVTSDRAILRRRRLVASCPAWLFINHAAVGWFFSRGRLALDTPGHDSSLPGWYAILDCSLRSFNTGSMIYSVGVGAVHPQREFSISMFDCTSLKVLISFRLFSSALE